MDAKSKANFINSVAGGEKVPCPQCSALNDAGSKFCTVCGSPLAPAPAEPAESVICAACGAANEAGSKFCIRCGGALEPAPAAALEAEMKPAAEVPFARVGSAQPASPEPPAPKAETAFAPVQQPAPQAPEAVPFPPAAAEEAEEPSAFALGLPDWDIVPPQVVVRRKRK